MVHKAVLVLSLASTASLVVAAPQQPKPDRRSPNADPSRFSDNIGEWRRAAEKDIRRAAVQKRQVGAFTCAATDDDGSALQPGSSDPATGKCVYQSSGVCEYFPGNGTFSSGASNCPGAMVAGSPNTPPTVTTTTVPQQPNPTTLVPPTTTQLTVAPPTITTPLPGTTTPITTNLPGTSLTVSSPAAPSQSSPGNGALSSFAARGPGMIGVLSVLLGVLGAGFVF